MTDMGLWCLECLKRIAQRAGAAAIDFEERECGIALRRSGLMGLLLYREWCYSIIMSMSSSHPWWLYERLRRLRYWLSRSVYRENHQLEDDAHGRVWLIGELFSKFYQPLQDDHAPFKLERGICSLLASNGFIVLDLVDTRCLPVS